MALRVARAKDTKETLDSCRRERGSKRRHGIAVVRVMADAENRAGGWGMVGFSAKKERGVWEVDAETEGVVTEMESVEGAEENERLEGGGGV